MEGKSPILQGNRCTKAGFKTKAAARQAEAKKREEIENPPPVVETPTDMAFWIWLISGWTM